MSNQPPEPTGADTPSGSLIFIVDDEPLLLQLALSVLKAKGHEIRTFLDPRNALESFKLSRPRPALVVTDYSMPQMSGMNLIESIRQLQPDQKILLVSGTVESEHLEKMTVKPDVFLPKPYLGEEFAKVIDQLLA